MRAPNEYFVNVAILVAGASSSELPFCGKRSTWYRNIIPLDTYHTGLAISVAQSSGDTLSLHLTGEFPVTKTVREGT